MRMLGSSVLVMEAFTMGFALLIAMNSSDPWELILGGVLAIFLLLTPGLLRGKSGWVIGSLLQIPLVGYGTVVTSMYVLGGIFALLWIAAIIVGRAGEAARARLTRQ
ncbi:MAG: DUF4233 domain-containing protein [Actinobacteria bacterium]|uniref:DUF4233 domain-containing protein n=1 Tax=Candidatus Fonsibacter lacus TaxID=2576439 RepID=A0A965GC00_9PROT|nr:DUF4233 domain-containing protein [Candidatus Fonsibacter lacus]